MAAYFVLQYEVNDPDLYREYQRGAGPTIQAHGVELVAFDAAAKTIEGTPPGKQTVILGFRDTDHFNEWYNSDEYRAVIGKRHAAIEGFGVLSQSMNPG